MKQIELRLALVFYGGVSLAIYMHGVSREILNLQRASHARGAGNGAAEKARAGLRESTKAYFDLLEGLKYRADLRVVTDAIAGASAGGVNGIMLARAIAHDLPLEHHRDLWLENADVTRLARPQPGFSRYLKSGISPVLDRLISSQLKTGIESSETREKLRTLMQSRWFKPPFSGERYAGWMLDACAGMDEFYRDGATLLPRGQVIDLFVTLTDYHGRKRLISIDDPAQIEEWEHRRILRFRARHRVAGIVESGLGPECVPELVFAARATSSFPGAFPPATLSEMDRLLDRRRIDWPNRERFVNEALGTDGTEPARRYFIDGSVVMNKPFAPVIRAIKERPASREVVRRLVYVDPTPPVPGEGGSEGDPAPSFFRVILASLARIPRNEPVGDDLKEIEVRNRRARWLSETIAAVDPLVDIEVSKILEKASQAPLTVGELTRCRVSANAEAHAQAGYAYVNYQSLKLQAVAERLSGLIAKLAWRGQAVVREDRVSAALRDHLRKLALETLPEEPTIQPAVIKFLKSFDVDYRIRRLRLAIRKLNGFYHQISRDLDERTSEDLDRLKGELYEQIDHLGSRWSPKFFGNTTVGMAVRATTSEDPAELTALLERLDTSMGLRDLDRLHDDVFAVMTFNDLPADMHREMTRGYVGFAFYDLATLPVLQRNDFSEVTETQVDRISPTDAGSLKQDGFELKGAALNTFGAFFNRSWREHDYLWGRLSAADRLVSIVLSSVDAGDVPPDWVRGLRRRLLCAILDEEEDHLTADPDLVPGIRALIDERLS